MLQLDELHSRAKEMRYEQTKYERRFAKRLTMARLNFHCQHVIGFYIADFVLPEKMLIVEIDGKQHSTPDAVVYDKRRTEFLKSLGFSVVRLQNSNVKSYPIEKIIDKPDYSAWIFEAAITRAVVEYHKTIARNESGETAYWLALKQSRKQNRLKKKKKENKQPPPAPQWKPTPAKLRLIKRTKRQCA